jgi:hypothetical protein
MEKVRPLSLLLLAPAALLCASNLGAEALPLDLEVGYRWVDVTGNDQMYRTQINDRPGLLLRSLNYTADAPIDGVFDHLHIDASDVGAGPAGQLRLLAGQVGTYRLTFTWRMTDLFSALPAFANPFLAEGIIPGQHTYNRTRNIYDATLELLPGKVVTPILGFTRNVYSGPGTTTYTLGGNDFLLNNNVSTVDDEYRLGLGFNAGPVQGAVIQGWRYFRETDNSTLVPGAGDGNNLGPILGQPITAGSISSQSSNKTNTPATSVWVTGRFFEHLKIIGSYVRADASGDTNFLEADSGSFVSFEIARFFGGLNQTISSKATTDYWRGIARAEFNLTPNIVVAGGWNELSRTLDGSALISSLFLDTVTYAGVSMGNFLDQIHAVTSVDRRDTVYDAGVTANLLGPFSANAGWSQTQQHVTVTPDASEIVVPGGQGGTFDRTVNTYGGGLTFAQSGFTLTADLRHDHADDPIFRMDFIDRDRYKARAGWNYRDILNIGGSFQQTDADDDVVEIGYRTKVREIMADLSVTLVPKILTLTASGGQFKVNRQILIRVPQDFTIVPELQSELGNTWEGGLNLTLDRLTVQGGYLWFKNNGSIPFTVQRARARAEYAVLKDWGLAFEWLKDSYNERAAFDQADGLANYNANRYYVGIHWHP